MEKYNEENKKLLRMKKTIKKKFKSMY